MPALVVAMLAMPGVLGLGCAWRGKPSAAPRERYPTEWAACERGEAAGCVAFGGAIVRDTDASDQRARREAFTAFERACTLGHAGSCAYVALGYEEGIPVPGTKDPDRARERFERACDLGDVDACNDMSIRYRTGIRGWARDPERALAADARACRLGAREACLQAASMLLDGADGVEPDRERAEQILRWNFCGMRDESCTVELAAYYLASQRHGPEAPAHAADATRARALLEEACKRSEPRACAGLAELLARALGGGKDVPRAIKLYAAACAAGERQACLSAGYLRLHDRMVRNPGLAARDLARSCDAASGAALDCELRNAGILADAGELRRAAPVFARHCESGALDVCVHWGRVLEQLGNRRKAAALYQRACDGGRMYGCTHLATMMVTGRGVTKDLTGAEALLRHACDRGYADACSTTENLASLNRELASGAKQATPVALDALFRPLLLSPFVPLAPRDVFSWWYEH